MIRKKFWNRYKLEDLNRREWELLCDGCGKCCLIKIDTGDRKPVTYTKIACRLFDDSTCSCTQYKMRKELVKDCLVLTKQTLEKCYSWMPSTCAYRLLKEGKKLKPWHHLISGSFETVHQAGISIKEKTLKEFDIPEEDWQNHCMEE